MTRYRDLAAAERALAQAAIQRAGKLRHEAAQAAFNDTAVELARQAAEQEWAVDSHLESARRYERLADEQGEPAH